VPQHLVGAPLAGSRVMAESRARSPPALGLDDDEHGLEQLGDLDRAEGRGGRAHRDRPDRGSPRRMSVSSAPPSLTHSFHGAGPGGRAGNGAPPGPAGPPPKGAPTVSPVPTPTPPAYPQLPPPSPTPTWRPPVGGAEGGYSTVSARTGRPSGVRMYASCSGRP